MTSLLRWGIRNLLTINAIIALVLIFGVISMRTINRETFPTVIPDQVEISVPFPGASAQEVEEGIILKLEEAIEGIPEIEEVRATAMENMASMLVILRTGASVQDRLQELKNAVDGIVGLPADAERPIVSLQRRVSRVMTLALHGSADRESLRRTAERLREELQDLDAVSLASVQGVPERQIAIEPREADLRRLGLSFDEITRRVRDYSLNLSGGSIKTDVEELRLRVYGRRYEAAQYADIPLRVLPSGAIIRLGDAADVREDWEDRPDALWYQGKTAVTILVEKTNDEDSITIVKAVKQWLAEATNQLPGDLELTIVRDTTIGLRQRIQLLATNGLQGLFLVLFTLTLFLNLRLAAWVALGIPVAYAGMFFLMGFTPATINVMSLFGMILVLGMLVDDGIVVAENIYTMTEQGVPPHEAAIRGTREVIPAVVASISTTVIAFIPFFFMEGRMGMFIWQMALMVILALAFSLLECIFLLPPHLAHSRALRANHKPVGALRRRINGWIDLVIRRWFSRSLAAILRVHWVTVSIGSSALLLSIGMLTSGRLPFQFFPRIDQDDVILELRMAAGTRERRTLEVLQELEQVALGMEEWLQAAQPDGQRVLQSMTVELGPQSEQGRVTLRLLDSEVRAMASQDVVREWRRRLPPVPDAEDLTAGQSGRSFGQPVNLRISGADPAELDRATEWLKARLKQLPALTDIKDNRSLGKRELRLRMKPQGEALGLTLSEAARQVRQAFYGQEILRYQRGKDEIKVWARLGAADRASVEQLRDIRLRTPSGALVPFGEAVDFEIGPSLQEIRHVNGRRVIEVSADVDEKSPGAASVQADLRALVLPELARAHPTIRSAWGGEQEQQAMSSASMRRTFPMALLGIAFILIATFGSLVQMGIVLAMIPLGLVGAILGHLLLGKPLSILSVYGLVGLAGIIVNASVVFVDRINRELELGNSVRDAVYQAGLKRIRPILLTTATTVAGMMPIILQTSRQAQFLIPMAISIAFGLLFGTIFTLYIIPSLYMVTNDLRRLGAYFVNRLAGRFVMGEPQEPGSWWPTAESLEPAVIRARQETQP
ncbi:MAG: efflux RND transporter permease subunit [bacterium]|nr:efflux RND transporter permease subunit [bacterium]